jgi:hypothetical protein
MFANNIVRNKSQHNASETRYNSEGSFVGHYSVRGNDMLNNLNIIALPIFCTMVCGAVWLRMHYKKSSPSSSRVSGIAVTVVGVCAWMVTSYWTMNPTTRVLGFPFTAAIYELHDGLWVDYVGTITMPALIANFMFWLLVFRLPLMWFRFSHFIGQCGRDAHAP